MLTSLGQLENTLESLIILHSIVISCDKQVPRIAGKFGGYYNYLTKLCVILSFLLFPAQGAVTETEG